MIAQDTSQIDAIYGQSPKNGMPMLKLELPVPMNDEDRARGLNFLRRSVQCYVNGFCESDDQIGLFLEG